MSTHSNIPATPIKKYSSDLIRQPEYNLTGSVMGTPIQGDFMATPEGKDIRRDNIMGVRKKSRKENLPDPTNLWELGLSTR